MDMKGSLPVECHGSSRRIRPTALALVLAAAVGACSDDGRFVIQTVGLPSGTQERDYEATITAHGGTGELVWSVAGGALPPGVELVDASGSSVRLRGQPSLPGEFAFELAARDDTGARATRSFTIGIASSLRIDVAPLPDADEQQVYQAEIRARGGTGQGHRWSVSAGELPPGLALEDTNAAILRVTGTPAPGRFSFTLLVEDSSGTRASADLTLRVRSSLAIEAEPASFQVGAFASTSLRVTGGTGNFQWQIVSGNVPGLSLSVVGPDTAELSGVPEAAGDQVMQLLVQDDNGGRAEADVELIIRDPLAIETTILPSAQHGVAYSAAITGRGGFSTSYQWAIAAGELPPGLSLASDGSAIATISGTPTANGTYGCAVELTTADDGQVVQQTFHITVAENPPRIITENLPEASWGASYRATIEGEAGAGGAVQWNVVSGLLPPGLSLSPGTGTNLEVTGTPSVSGAFSFGISMTNDGGVAQAAFTLAVAAPEVFEVVGRVLPRGRIDDDYPAVRIATRHAAGQVAWSIASGELPPGLALTADGVDSATLTGVPTSSGFYRFTVQAVDGTGATSSKAMALLVRPATSWAAAATSRNSICAPQDVTFVDVTGDTPAPPRVVATNVGSSSCSDMVGDFAISPDGRFATYTYGTLSTKSLYRVDLRGDVAIPSTLVTTQLRGDRPNPAIWSPDGGRAAVAVQTGNYEFTYHVMDVSGEMPSWVALAGAPASYAVKWSPDGTAIAYASANGATLYIAEHTGAAWNVRSVPTGGAGVGTIVWLPDSSGLVYSATVAGQFGLSSINREAAQPAPVRLTPPELDYNPNFVEVAADGGRLLLSDRWYGNTNQSLWLVELGQRAMAQSAEISGSVGGVFYFSWSPDSRHVLINDDQGGPVYLGDSQAPPDAPPAPLPFAELGALRQSRWSPDGTQLAYSSDTGLYLVNLVGAMQVEPVVTGISYFLGDFAYVDGSPFFVYSYQGLQAIDTSIPAAQRMAVRLNPDGPTGVYFRVDPVRTRVYYYDFQTHQLYFVSLAGGAPSTPVAIASFPGGTVTYATSE
jgi:Tol biopolymer transport system component